MTKHESLSKKLAFLSSSVDTFDNPFTEEDNVSSIQAITIANIDDRNEEHAKNEKKKSKFEKIMENGQKLKEQYSNDRIFDFEAYLENGLIDDEDSDLKNSLIGMGRKYARETKASAESSEISKAFSKSEKALNDLFSEIEKDKVLVQKDIDTIRMMRTKNFKTLSELIEVKTTFHNTALSVIKEMNNIKKAQLDLTMKSNKSKAENEESGGDAGKAIQQLFGIGRENILSSVGGYEGISGAKTEDDVDIDDSAYDEIIQKKYFNNDTPSSDGDKFLKYENCGVEYVLLLDEDGSKTVLAEDRDGNIIPDYPMPSNLDELNFDISDSTGTATDDLHRKYNVRLISNSSDQDND